MISAPDIAPPPINLLPLVEKMVLFSAAFLAMLPLQQLFMVPFVGGALNTFETAYVVLLFCLVLLSLNYYSLQKSKPFVLILLTIFFYSAVQLVLNSNSLFNIIKQLRYFLPFLSATILLAVAPKKIYLKETLYYLCIAATISAVVSLVMHFFFQETLIRIILGSSDPAAGNHLALLIRSGRSPWGNATLVYITVIALGYINAFPRRQQLVIKFAVCATILGALATLSRTTMLGLLLIALLAPLVYYRKTAPKLTYYFRMAFVLVFVVMSVLALSLVNDRFGKSLALRFAINVGVSEVVDSAITGNRDVLYDQYMERLVNGLPLGQGIGKPYAVLPERGAFYTVDNSYLAFMLPFGLVGLLIFLGFLYQLRKLMGPRSPDLASERFRKFMTLVVGVTMLIALNMDIFSRNNYVLFITLIALAYHNSRREENI